MAKYKRFRTILKEAGYEDRPVEFLRELMERHRNVREAATAIGTTHETLYNQLEAHGLVVESKGVAVREKAKEE
jgi:transcriptional regulator with PAS, ATPase and Fis domain